MHNHDVYACVYTYICMRGVYAQAWVYVYSACVYVCVLFVYITLTNQAEELKQEDEVNEVQVSVAHAALRSHNNDNQANPMIDDDGANAEDVGEAPAEDAALPQENLVTEDNQVLSNEEGALQQAAEVMKKEAQLKEAAELEGEAQPESDTAAEDKAAKVDCVYDTSMSNEKGVECKSKLLRRQAHELETLRGLEEIAKVLHSLNQHAEAMNVERQARDIQRELDQMGLIPTGD